MSTQYMWNGIKSSLHDLHELSRLLHTSLLWSALPKTLVNDRFVFPSILHTPAVII